MKIALCLSGQPRGVPLALSFLQKHVINPNGINDIFIHAWFDEKEAGKTWNSAQPHRNSENQDFGNPQHAKDVGFIKSGTDKILLECLEPKKAIIEPQKNFDHLKNLPKIDSRCKPEIMGSAFYSMHMANKLANEYAQENNFEYDLVIRTRTDMYYAHDIVLGNYYNPSSDRELIVVDKCFQDDQDNLNSPDQPMVDIFAFGHPSKMSVFCDVYNNMTLINREMNLPLGENYLGYWVKNKNGIQLKKENLNLGILARSMNLDLSRV